MIKDNYNTIEESHFEELREKASKFLAFAYSVYNQNDVQGKLEALKHAHPKANHYCYAYLLGVNGEEYRANDDGEPSGTAGNPIMGQIKSHGLTNVLVVVVRYFGGTKLGASGLIAAYKDSTNLVLSNCKIIEKYIHESYKFTFTFENMGNVMNELKHLNFDIVEKNFDHTPNVIAHIRTSIASDLIKKLKSRLLNISLDRISEETVIEGLIIEKLQ